MRPDVAMWALVASIEASFNVSEEGIHKLWVMVVTE